MNKIIFEHARKSYISEFMVGGGCSQCFFNDNFFNHLRGVNKELKEKMESVSYDEGDSSCAFHAKIYNQVFGFKFPLDKNGDHHRIDCDYYILKQIDVLHPVEVCNRCLKI